MLSCLKTQNVMPASRNAPCIDLKLANQKGQSISRAFCLTMKVLWNVKSVKMDSYTSKLFKIFTLNAIFATTVIALHGDNTITGLCFNPVL